MSDNYNELVQSIHTEECYSFFVGWLQQRLTRGHWDAGDYDFQVSQVFHDFLSARNLIPNGMWQTDFIHGWLSNKFQDVAWSLAVQGAIRPTRRTLLRTIVKDHVVDGYSLTTDGQTWLTSESTDIFARGPQHLVKLLCEFESNFGSDYATRAREAANSLNARCYLACCAMCGAAAESILLCLSTEMLGSRAEAERIYYGKSGRDRLYKALTDQKAQGLQNTISSAFNILKHWRDESSHGASSSCGRDHAMEAIRILHSLAQTAKKDWAILVRPAGSGEKNNSAPNPISGSDNNRG